MSVEDIKVQLNGSCVFSTLDMNEAYHQIELAKESRHLTTFYGVGGRLRYRRLNYGTISSQDIFDRCVDDTIRGLKGVVHIRDDFIVHGSNREEHDDRLYKFLQRMRECNLTLSPKKCKIGEPSIEFFGIQFNSTGTSPSPSKVAAIQQMSKPSNSSELRSLLGMAQFSAPYIVGFAEITAPLRKLTKLTASWEWGQEQEKAFKRLKTSLSDQAVLSYYEVGLPCRLTVDAGPKGIGLILSQKKKKGWQAVACHSRSLTDAEQRYSQLEREALAIRWGCERCYQYLIGSQFTVVTDHKPLLPMINNPHSRPPLRIERWLMYLQQFDFQLEYGKGIENTADYLSRHYLPATSDDELVSRGREEVTRAIIQAMVPKALSLEEIQQETGADKTCQDLIEAIQGRYDRVKKEPHLKQFRQVFQELSYAQGVITRGEQILIPKSLQERVINICHEAHLGISKSKQILRSKVWFPNINQMMEAKVAGCIPCQAATSVKRRDPVIPSQIPNAPWMSCAADFYGPLRSGHYILVVVDDFSRYPEVETVTSTSAAATIPKLDCIFARQGLPQSIKTDNGPPFNSEQFRSYLLNMGVRHQRVTPYWPEANGEAERFMASLNKTMKTAQTEGTDWTVALNNFLRCYRSAPHTSTGVAPYTALYNRTMRTKLPELIIPVIDIERLHSQIKQNDAEAKNYMKNQADTARRTRPHQFRLGDRVLLKQIHTRKGSNPYEVVPYVITNSHGTQLTAQRESDGRVVKRNSSHFKLLRDFTNAEDSMSAKELDNAKEPDDDIMNTPEHSHFEEQERHSHAEECSPLTHELSQSEVNVDPPSPSSTSSSNDGIAPVRPTRARREPAYLKDYVK